MDGPADLRLGHAHLLQRAEPGLVLVALGDLLVVDDEDRGQEEQEAQENAQEEETAKEEKKPHSSLARDSRVMSSWPRERTDSRMALYSSICVAFSAPVSKQ